MKRQKLAVIGMGYVGKTLAETLCEAHDVCCIDINPHVFENIDTAKFYSYGTSYDIVYECSAVFVCVPTPVEKDEMTNRKLPVTKYLDQCMSKLIHYKGIVCIESTVAPGTADKYKKIMKCDIVSSPERINPLVYEGNVHAYMSNEVKVVGSDNKEARDYICEIYTSADEFLDVYTLDTNIQAEYTKLLENIQRDVNIALMNEFAEIVKKDNVNFENIIRAATTKSNFNSYHPGLVGGHCIGVDSYYLLDYAKNYNGIIQKARDVNENTIYRCICEILDIIKKKDIKHIVVLGYAYKPNINDTRESGILRIIDYIKKFYNIDIQMYDTLVNPDDNLPVINDDTCIIIGQYHNDMNDVYQDISKQTVYNFNNVVYNTTFANHLRSIFKYTTYYSAFGNDEQISY